MEQYVVPKIYVTYLEHFSINRLERNENLFISSYRAPNYMKLFKLFQQMLETD